ncbi:MAG TPA: hypothetical protein VJ063_10670 [Verrucomicrobiae bacterium]|nr:hypothetical protein [Verrucomicrobiae bacterium]
MFFVLALLATLCGAYHLIENWQGKKKWEVYKRQLVAQGVKLDLASFIPPPIPDEDNFAASPFFAEVLPGPLPTNWNRWPKLINGLRPQTNAEKRNERHLTDLVAYQVALRAYNRQDTNSVSGNRAEAAKELIAAMKIYEPPRQELIAASARPRARYNIKYDLDNPWGILVPHLGVIKQVCQDLSFKACAELALRNNEQAMEDVRLMARLTHSLDTELFLITYMVKVACLQLLVQPIWEGLADGQWSVAQLEELQGIMSEFNLVGDLVVPLGMEQAAGVLTGDILLKHKKKAELFNALFNGGTRSPFASLSVSMVPRGWFYLEQYNCARLFQQFIWPGFDPTNRIIEPQVSDQNAAKLNKLLTETKHPIFNHLFFATQLLPAVDKAQRRAAQAQTAAHEVTIACALERYRRKHGDYPGHLDALTPEFMKVVPHDVIGGKPMHYKAGKPFVLYSVGWDTKDNGGASGRMLWDDRGDWVWTYPQ